MEMDQIKKDAKERMEKSLHALEKELAKLRTGRASADRQAMRSPFSQLISALRQHSRIAVAG